MSDTNAGPFSKIALPKKELVSNNRKSPSKGDAKISEEITKEGGQVDQKKSASHHQETDPHPTWRSWRFARLFYSIIVVNLLLMNLGISLTYSSPLMDQMIREANSTPWVDGFDNCVHQSLIGPTVLIGGTIGGLLSSIVINLLGLVLSLILSSVLFVAGWTMIGVSWFVGYSPTSFRSLILTGRFVTGLAFGLLSPSWAVYVGELSSTKYRATLMAIGYVVYAIGVTMSYLFGAFFPYWVCAFIYGGITVALIPLVAGVTESSSRNRNIVKNAKRMLTNLKIQRDMLVREFTLGPFFRRIIMIEAVFFSHSFMGYVALIQYVGPILNVAGARNWHIPHGVLVALAVGGGDIMGSLLSILASLRLKHVFSAFIGAVGVCIGHLGIATYFVIIDGLGPHEVFHERGYINESISGICFFEPAIKADIGQKYSPLALICIAIVMVMYGAFWMMQPYVISVELFNDETRELGAGIAMASESTYYIVLSFLFPWLEATIGIALLFFILAFIAVLTAIMIPTLVPETKGKVMGERGDTFTPKQNWIELFQPIKELCKRALKKLPSH